MAKPMPWVEPVMRAVLPDRSMFMEGLALEWGDKRDDCVGGRLVQEITIFLAAHNPCGSEPAREGAGTFYINLADRQLSSERRPDQSRSHRFFCVLCLLAQCPQNLMGHLHPIRNRVILVGHDHDADVFARHEIGR